MWMAARRSDVTQDYLSHRVLYTCMCCTAITQQAILMNQSPQWKAAGFLYSFILPCIQKTLDSGVSCFFFYITTSLCDDRCPRWTYTVVHNVFVRHTITAAIQLQFFYGSGRPGGIFLTTISQLKLHKAKPILFQEMFKATIVCVNTIKYWHKYSGFHWHSAWSMWQLLWIKLSHFITHNAQVFCILQTRRFFSTGVKSDLLQV